MGMDTDGFHGYGTSDDYFIQAVWPLASCELRRLSKEGRGFTLRGRGRVLKGGMVEVILDVPNRGGGGGTVPLVARVTGSYMTSGDGEYSVHMETPSFAATHSHHEPMTGDPQADAAKVAGDIADMVDDMIPALPGGAVPTASRRASVAVGETIEHADGVGATDIPVGATVSFACGVDQGHVTCEVGLKDGEKCLRPLGTRSPRGPYPDPVMWGYGPMTVLSLPEASHPAPDGRSACRARRVALRLVRARKMHLKVVLDMFVVSDDDDEDLDLGGSIREALDGALGGRLGTRGMEVQDVTVESVEVTDSR